MRVARRTRWLPNRDVRIRGGSRAGGARSLARVVILATGHGLKDVEAPLSRISIPAAIEPTLEAVPA